LLNKEALRVVKSSPKWTPGIQKGKLVKVKYVFPVNFNMKK
jgi:protein TonB